MPLATCFYPRLVYNAVTIDCTDPVGVIVAPEVPIRGGNVAVAGVQETLFERIEVQVTLGFRLLPSAKVSELWTYWSTWGAARKQAVITLDRFATAAGQWEYDRYNTFFTKAELVTDRFLPVRAFLTRALYHLDLTWRQGQ